MADEHQDHAPLTAPANLRKLMIRAWDSDAGNGTLRPDLWHVFLIACELEFLQRGIEGSGAVDEVRRCATIVWTGRNTRYDKARWRKLDAAIFQIFGGGSGW